MVAIKTSRNTKVKMTELDLDEFIVLVEEMFYSQLKEIDRILERLQDG
jgi:hypothetical protein